MSQTPGRRQPYPTTGSATAGTHTHSIHTGTIEGRGAVVETALGIDRADTGVLGGTPRLILENAGFTIWEVDNDGGTLRIFTPTGGVRVQLDPNGNLTMPTGGVTAPTVAVTGAGAGLVFYDRTGTAAWQWYTSGNIARLHNGTADTITVNNAGLLTAPALDVTAAPPTPVAVGTANAVGASLKPARSDHVHAGMSLVHAAYTANASTSYADGVEDRVYCNVLIEDTAGVHYDNAGVSEGFWIDPGGDGLFLITVEMKWDLAPAVATTFNRLTVHIIKNITGGGSGRTEVLLADDHREPFTVPASGGAQPSVSATAVARLVSGDHIAFKALQQNNAFASFSNVVGAQHSPRITITRIGP